MLLRVGWRLFKWYQHLFQHSFNIFRPRWDDVVWCWTTVFQTVPRSFDISAWIFSQKCERQTLICAYAFLKRLKCGATFLEQRKRWDDVRWKFEGNQTPFKMFQHCWEACKHSFNTCWAGVGRVFAHLNVGTVWRVIQPFSPTSLSGCKISLHYPHKTSCFVMRKNNLIIYSNLSKMKSKILPTCLQGYFRDSLEDIWHFGGLFHRENVLGFFVEKLRAVFDQNQNPHNFLVQIVSQDFMNDLGSCRGRDSVLPFRRGFKLFC